MSQLNTPILFILFNRTDTSLQVLQSIRQAKPRKLYFFADGPRPNVASDKEQCAQARRITEQVDWPCEVKTYFLSENLGPRLALGKGIGWFFEHEEEGIILEHDCLPSKSFYTFCETLLEYYRDDERIMHISGNNFQFGIQRGNGSYYFSRYNHIWGFATWRKAWKHYNVEMPLYPGFEKENMLRYIFSAPRQQKYWRQILRDTYEQRIQTWDYQWTFAMWCQNGLAIIPQVNLVSNIGFDKMALNTIDRNHKIANMPRGEISEIIHPMYIIHCQSADDYSLDNAFFLPFYKRIRILKKLLALGNSLWDYTVRKKTGRVAIK